MLMSHLGYTDDIISHLRWGISQDSCLHSLSYPHSSRIWQSQLYFITSDDFPVIADSGCTIAASSNIDDLKPSLYTTAQNVALHGIFARLKVAGISYVNWTCTDQFNLPVTMWDHAIHVPDWAVWLLPLQQIVSTKSTNCKNSFINGSIGSTITIIFLWWPYQLAHMHTIPGVHWFTSFKEQPNLTLPLW